MKWKVLWREKDCGISLKKVLQDRGASPEEEILERTRMKGDSLQLEVMQKAPGSFEITGETTTLVEETAAGVTAAVQEDLLE